MKKILFSLTLLGAVEVSHCSDELFASTMFTGVGLIPVGAGMILWGSTQQDQSLILGGTGIVLLGGAVGFASYLSLFRLNLPPMYRSTPILWQNSPTPIRNEWKRLKMDFELMDR